MKKLCLLSLVSLAFPVVATAAMTFSDVPKGAWYEGYVNDAAALDIVSGYKDAQGNPTGIFGPGDNVTIAQVFKIAVVGAGYDPALYLKPSDLQDAPGRHWAYKYLGVSLFENFFAVLLDVGTEYDRPATRAEVAAVFAGAFKADMSRPLGNEFTDVLAQTKYANGIEALMRDGVVSGDTDANGESLHRFRPMDNIVRAEVVKMVMAARAKYGTPGKGRTIKSTGDASME